MLTSFCSEGAAGTTYLTIQQSADSGRHWTTVPGQPVRLVNDGRSHTAIAAASARVLAVAWANRLDSGRYGGLTVSRDGGRTGTDAAVPKTGAGWRYIGARSATALGARRPAHRGVVDQRHRRPQLDASSDPVARQALGGRPVQALVTKQPQVARAGRGVGLHW